MQASEASSCDLWDGEQIHLPLHSRLYHLEPIGVGSPMVESLTSYLTRLAEAHSLHLSTLVTDEILPRLRQSHLYCDGNPTYSHLTRFWKQSAMLNGTSTTSRDWVQALEQLTLRADLRFLTMLTWASVLSSRELLRRTQAWCPLCYEEWRERGQIIYQPLLWALEVICVCPSHGLRLQRHCPYADCGNEFLALGPRFQTGYCPRCTRWLGNSFAQNGNSQGPGIEEQERQQWVGTVVGELLAAAPGFTTSPQREVIAAAVTSHVQTVMEGNFSAFARQLQVHRRTAWEWGQGLQVPQLDTFLQLCSYFRTDLVHFFMGYALETVPAQKPTPEAKMWSEKPKRQLRRFETERLRCVLQGVLQGEENPPPSMREVGRRLQYDASHLYRHFPDLCQAIAGRYRSYQKERRRLRLQGVCEEVQRAAQAVQAQGRIPSERQIGKQIRSRGLLKEDEVRTALYSIRREEGQKT